jgi:hypothetical protein
MIVEEEIGVHRPFKIHVLQRPSRKIRTTFLLLRDRKKEVKEGLVPVGIVTVSKTLTLEGHHR